MADVLDIDVVYVGQQATDVLLKPIFFDKDIMQEIRVEPNIKFKKQLALDSRYEKILKASKGCSRDDQDDVINISEKFLEVCPLEADLSQCAKNLTDEFMSDWLRKGGLEENDLTGTKVEKYISTKVQQALALDVQRIIWLGDTSSLDSNYNMCDGFWTRIIAGVADYSIEKVYNIGNGTVSATTARDTLRALYNDADPILKSIDKKDKKFWVTETVGDALMDFYEDTENAGGFVKMTMDGQEKLLYRGVEVVVLRNIDRWIDADSLGNPNRAIYAASDNLVVGTDMVSDTNKMDFWYDKLNKLNRIDVEMKLGTQILYGDLVAVAY